MGGCFSVSFSCDQVLNQVTQWLCVKESYVHKLEENLAALEATMDDLKARRNDLLRKVETEENKGLRRLDQIQVWLSRVETIESQVDDLLSVKTAEIQRLCLCGFCSKNLKLSYRYGKRVFMMLKEVENHKSNGVFEVVAEQAQASEVVERPIQPRIVGQERVLETAWNRLMEEGVGILGLYGMGGVGKTTLLTQINNKFLQKEVAFDVVIWVVVSKDLQVQKIQEEVAKKIGLEGNDWNHKDEDQKACDILRVLRRKKFVLLLDDIWAKVDLKKIGVPYPNRENGSKVVFTTRSQELCRRMRVDIELEVQCLTPRDALGLFLYNVGEITLRSHPNIPELAMVVAYKCHGLPLTLNVIGEAMSCKRTIQEWHHAIAVLTSNSAKFSGMEEEILSILKYSYDNLKGEHVKSCLLYCALFPEDHKITKPRLIEYWICEGFIDESEGMERAENQGYEIIGSLIRSSLLIEVELFGTFIVCMHDVIRDMVLWIASNFVVCAGAGISDILTVKNWNNVKRMSLISNKIDRISGSLECLELTTLFLQRNVKLVNIAGEFFRSMPRLVVLDLSNNIRLSELPDEISELVSLRYLNMSYTDIENLPVGLQELKSLIHLNLEETSRLLSIVGVSALLNLKVLKLQGSRVAYNPNTVEELQALGHLEILSIGITFDSGLDQLLSSQKLKCCTETLEIKGLQVESSHISVLASMEKVDTLYFDECTVSEMKIDDIVSISNNPKNACFLSLSTIKLTRCNLWDLSWLMFAPNLTVLFVIGGGELENVINKENACVCESSGVVPFQRLQLLLLVDLLELKNIYWRSLPLPCLSGIILRNCPKLRKLPLNSKSSSGGEKGLNIHYSQREWLDGVEWEDEATKARFLPSCIHV